MSKEPFRVTDHAVLRYMERAMGLNTEIVRAHIEQLCKGPAAVGAVAVRAEGVRFEIRNNTVLTVAPDRQNPSNTGRAMVQDQLQRKKREQEDIRHLDIRSVDRVYELRGRAGPVADPGAAGFAAGTFADPGGPGEVLSGD